jgi:tetratricopeptide (TPR) repeat protein
MSARKHVIAGAIALAAISGFAGPAARAQTAQQLNWCNGKDDATPDLTIIGCTAGIQSGKFTGKTLATLFFLRAYAYLQTGQLDGAIEDYNQAIRFDPNLTDVYKWRGEIYLAKGDADHAIADFTEVIRLYPEFSNGYFNRGNAYFGKRITTSPSPITTRHFGFIPIPAAAISTGATRILKKRITTKPSPTTARPSSSSPITMLPTSNADSCIKTRTIMNTPY